MINKKKINVAIIGCGLIGNKRATNLNKRCNIIAVCDSNKNRANIVLKKNRNIKFYSNWKDIFNLENLDCAIVCTPHDLLFKIAAYGIKKNSINLFIEKPGVKNFSEIKKLIKIYNSIKGKKIAIRFGFNHRFHKSIIFANKLIKQNKIGKLLYLRGIYGHGGKKNYKKEWRGIKRKSGGGQLIDQGIHLIDLSRYFLGNLKAYNKHLDTIYWNTKVEDNVFLTLKKEKKIAFLHASWTEWKNKFYLEIFGKRGKIEIEGKGGSYGKEKLTIYKMKKNKIKPDINIFQFGNEDNSWRTELDLFCKEMKTKNNSIFHLNNMYENFKIINEIYKK